MTLERIVFKIVCQMLSCFLFYLLFLNYSSITTLNRLYCGRVPAANAPGCTAAEGLLYKPWSLVVLTYTARCLHQRP